MVTISKKKKKVSETSIYKPPRMKNCISRLCTSPFTHVSHYWWKQSFRVFGTGFDWPSARLETAKKQSFRILVRIYCHNIPTCIP